jgi:hypothetical protein
MSSQGEKSYADLILKYVGTCIGLIYSVGFLVVARHLSRYGVSTFSVFQTQYLIAGVWTISPPIAFALVQRSAERFKDKAYSVSKVSWSRYALVSAAIGLPFGLLCAASIVLLGSVEGFSWSLAARLWGSYLLLAYPADLAWMSWRVPEEAARWWLNRHAIPYYLTVFTLGILLYALLFGGSVYPLIPASLGGGRPRRIVLIPVNGGLPKGIVKDNGSGRSVPYELLTVTDKSYVLISPSPNEESIEIGRESVEGIVVLKEDHAPPPIR